MGNEVKRVLTPLTELELVDALFYGHNRAFDLFPSSERLGVAWAQCALELDRGKAIWNNNIGNITVGKWTGDYYILHVPPPDPPTLKFRAHPSPLEGGKDYWEFLSSRYASALPFFDRSDAARAAQELGRLGYFLASVDKYASAMASLYREFNRRGLGEAEMRRHEAIPSPEELAIYGRLWWLADRLNRGEEGGLDDLPPEDPSSES